MKRSLRVALFGTPGAGKSTTTGFVEAFCRVRQLSFARVKLADPLYEAQASLYRIAGRDLQEFYQQDGELLNFLGSYLRKVNPNVLVDRFAMRVRAYEEEFALLPTPYIIACDDMRFPDAAWVRSLGFLHIVAKSATCVARRGDRGDRSLGSAEHPTERDLDKIVPDHVLENDGTCRGTRGKDIRTGGAVARMIW
jgi:hypothetical protein